MSDEKKQIINFYKNTVSLLFLCEVSSIKGNDLSFRFSKDSDELFKVEKSHIFEEDLYYQIYRWVVKKSDELVRVDNLLRIVREVLSRKKFEDITIKVISQLETAFNQSISGEIDKYFISQEKLKNEFIALEKAEFENQKRIQNEFLALIITLGTGIFGKVVTTTGEKEITKFSLNIFTSFPVKILLFTAIVATLYFGFIFAFEIHRQRKYFDKINKIYKEKLNFSDDEINYYLQKATYCKHREWIILAIVILTLIVLLVQR